MTQVLMAIYLLQGDSYEVKKGLNQGMSLDRIVIGVYPETSYTKNLRLFQALEDIFCVQFIHCSKNDIGHLKFALFFEVNEDLTLEAQHCDLRCFICLPNEHQTTGYYRQKIEFADNPEIDRSFRDGCFFEIDNQKPTSIPELPGDVVLAKKGGLPIWVRRACGSSFMDIVSGQPHVLASDEILREHFSRHSITHILPLLHFVREAAGDFNWNPDCHRACIVIDDPSLYCHSYGYVTFKDLAEHAKQHGYHVAIATIPLDTCRANPKVASIFREYSENLSLIIHGNNHISLELARDRSSTRILALAAQALRRFKRFEEGYNINYSRIMEAPHGTFVNEAAEPLARLGYEATLYTPSQFISQNREQGYHASFGSCSVDGLPFGLCAIPRLVMSEDWRSEISIAAFLRQPIVLACHHQDFFEGLDLLSEFVSYINQLGNVQWSNLSEIAKTQYIAKKEGETWVAKLGGRHVECHVPLGVKEVIIHRPWVQDTEELLILKDISGKHESVSVMAREKTSAIPWKSDGLIIESPIATAVNPDTVSTPSDLFWPVVRKIAIEMRDRFYPYLPTSLVRYSRTKKSNYYGKELRQEHREQTNNAGS